VKKRMVSIKVKISHKAVPSITTFGLEILIILKYFIGLAVRT